MMMSHSIIVEEWRDLWSFKIEFILASFAYVLSIYNFFEVPHLIMTQGGVAFVVGYVAAAFLICLPLIVMELAVGQLTGRAPVQALLSVCPLFKGVGVAQILYSLIFMSYLAVPLGYLFWVIFYVFFDIHGELIPWLSCGNEWNTIDCKSVEFNSSSELTYSAQSSIVEFYTRHLINPTADTLEGISQINWKPVSSTGLVWILVFAAILAGVRWLGKVCYLSFIIPVGFLISLIVYLLILNVDVAQTMAEAIWAATNWDVMLRWDFWVTVFRQVLYATGIGFGAFITLGSYNKRNNNLVCDSILIIIVHLLLTALVVSTSLIFVGYFANAQNVPIMSLLSDDPIHNLHFLLAAIGTFEYTKIWSTLFLVSLSFILLNYFYVLALNLLATLEDAFGEKASRCAPRLFLAIFICAFGCASSLIHTTNVGTYTMELTYKYLDLLTPWAIIFFELLAIAWFYCAYMLGKDIKAMVANCCCWVIGFKFMLPLYFLPIVPVYICAAPYAGTIWMYDYATLLSSSVTAWNFSEYVGWVIACVPLLPIPLFMVYMIIKTCIRGPGTTKWQRFKYTIISPLRYEIVKPTPPPRYTATAPGYVLLPQAPLAEPENYQDVYGEHHVVRVSNI